MLGSGGAVERRLPIIIEFSIIHEVHDPRHARPSIDQIREIQKEHQTIQHPRLCEKSNEHPTTISN